MPEYEEDIIEEKPSEELPSAGMSAFETKIALGLRVVRQLKDQIDNLERLLESRAEPADLEFMAKSAPPGDSYESFDGKSIDGRRDRNMARRYRR